MTKLELQKWNAKYPEGSPCWLFTDDGKRTATVTSGSACFLPGFVPVVLLRGLHGYFHIETLHMAEKKIKHKMPRERCLSLAPPLHRPDENIENYAHPPERLRTLSDLVNAAERKKSVVCPGFHAWVKPKPAAVVINLSGAIIYELLNAGIYVYEKPKP